MSVEYTVDDVDGILHIKASGEISTLDHAVNHAKSFMKELKKRSQRKALIDHRGVEGDTLSFFEKYDFVSMMTNDEPVMKVLKWAVVVSPDRSKSLKDFETIARNRGFSLLGFHSIQEALDWLKN